MHAFTPGFQWVANQGHTRFPCTAPSRQLSKVWHTAEYVKWNIDNTRKEENRKKFKGIFTDGILLWARPAWSYRFSQNDAEVFLSLAYLPVLISTELPSTRLKTQKQETHWPLSLGLLGEDKFPLGGFTTSSETSGLEGSWRVRIWSCRVFLSSSYYWAFFLRGLIFQCFLLFFTAPAC